MVDDNESEFVKLLRGAAQVVDGLHTAASAVGPVLDKVDGVVNHLTAPATLERVAGAAAEAAVGAVVAEVRMGAERSHPRHPEPLAEPSPAEPPRGPTTMLRCGKHGVAPWSGTLCCATCGRVYQTHNEQAPLYAPDVCACGVRLAPTEAPGGGEFSGRPICTQCFIGLARSGGRAVRARQGRAS